MTSTHAVADSPSSEVPRTTDKGDVKQSSTEDYPGGFRLLTITFALCLAVFCVALDNTIIATAIPKITDDFEALNDVGWYGSAYLLTTCSFQLLFGKIYSAFNIKWVFLIALFLFEVGSLVCGIAPNSVTLIVGRAIAGLGSAGIFSGALIIIAYSVPIHQRPIYISLIGGMYGIASVAGPLMGGAFTDHVSWRWCFYINLPIGAITAVIILIFLRLATPPRPNIVGFRARIQQFDPIGTIVFIPAIVCLLLALQWGGSRYPWSNGRIIALFVLFGVLLIAFIGVQIWMGEAATVPPRIARQRSIAFGSLFALCIGSSFFVFIYYLPLWFQAIKNVSATDSGVDNLPLILAQVIAVILAGALTTRLGHYMPFIYASAIFMSVGAGLITRFRVDSPSRIWIGYQIIFGLGAGFGFQQAGIAAQTVLALNDVAIGTATVMFVQLLGGALFVSVGQNVFSNNLISNLLALRIPGLDPGRIVRTGATELRSVIPAGFVPEVLVAYNAALVKIFQVALIMACLSILGAIGMEWKSVKGMDEGKKEVAAMAA